MQRHLAELRRKRAAGESGFTLIELLVVVVIIGILIAIAIPVYLNYQKGAKDKSAASDLRSAVGALEQCNSDNSAYPATLTTTTGGTLTACTGQAINLSSGTTFSYALSTATPAFYVAVAFNTGGSLKSYCYNSSKGGAITSTSTNSASASAGATPTC